MYIQEDTTSSDIATVPSILGKNGKIRSFKDWYNEFKKAKGKLNDKQLKK